MANLLTNEIKEYTTHQNERKRRNSAIQRVIKLEEKQKETKKRPVVSSPTMAQLVLSGDISNRIVEKFIGVPISKTLIPGLTGSIVVAPPIGAFPNSINQL